ncbi:MAG: hypothetical protein WKF77_27785 [Planctomycetaceae bacterium]
MSRVNLNYRRKSALLVIGLFVFSLMLPACTFNAATIHKTNVQWGAGLFVSSFFSIFALSPVGLTHIALLVGLHAQFRGGWRKAVFAGVATFLLASSSFQFYEPAAQPIPWNHMTGSDQTKFRITKLLPGFYCWWSCGLVLVGAGTIGMLRSRAKDLEVNTLYEEAMDPVDSIEINRSEFGWRVCWTVAGLAVVFVLWEYHRYGPRNSETVILYFDRMSFISKDGDSNFKYLVINPESWVPPEWRASTRRSRPDLYLRLDGKTVLFIPDVTKDELQEHFEHHNMEKQLVGEAETESQEKPPEETVRSLSQSSVFVRNYQRKTVAYLGYYGHQATSIKFGDEYGEVSDPALNRQSAGWPLQ